VSVCGTVGIRRNFLDFSSQYYDRNQLQLQPFIPGLLDQLDGYNHEPASVTMPRI